MKYVICLLVVSIHFVYGNPNYDSLFTRESLRFDYIHYGNNNSDKIVLKKFKKEPFWGGSHKNLIDTFRYGHYYFEMRDSATNKLVYSRGFSTLFQEWQTTSEAKSNIKAFEESVSMPYPKKSITIQIYKRNEQQEFELLFQTYFNPKSYLTEQYAPFWQTKTIHNSGDASCKLDIVIIPDGYTTDEMQKFEQDASKYAAHLLQWSPFDRHTNKINIHIVYAPSPESGTDIPGKNIWKNTLVSSNFYTFDSERYLTTSEYWRVKDVASSVPYDQIYILVNTEKYGGGGIFNYYNVCSSDHKDSEFVFMHEFGHGFGGLADEYYTSSTAYENFYPEDVEPYQPNITTLVDFNHKWKDLIEPGTPIPTPATDQYIGKVGVFEGAGYVEKGIYRPTYDGTMKSRKLNDFGPVNERALINMLLFYAE